MTAPAHSTRTRLAVVAVATIVLAVIVNACVTAVLSMAGAGIGTIIGVWGLNTLFALTMLGLFVLVSRRYEAASRSVSRLASAATRIASQRDYSIRVEEEGDEAVRALCDGFNRMLAEIQAAEVEVRESEQRFRTLVENAPEAIVVFDIDTGFFMDVNGNAETLFGMTREELMHRSPIDVSPPEQPDGRDSAEAAAAYLGLAVEGGTPVFEWTHRHASGELVPCEIRLVRMPAADRCLVRGSITDISERRAAAARQKRLMQELDHRVKNTLAMVVSLADQTARRSTSVEGFVDDFVGRLRSLARTHEALAASRWAAIDLLDVARLTLEPYIGDLGDRVVIAGRSQQLYPEAAAPICMALHELATNAAKYGALAGAAGTVTIDWRCPDEGLVELSWIETGVEDLETEPEAGLGTKLIRGLVEHELMGRVAMDFRCGGLDCTLSFPLRRGAAAARAGSILAGDAEGSG